MGAATFPGSLIIVHQILYVHDFPLLVYPMGLKTLTVPISELITH